MMQSYGVRDVWTVSHGVNEEVVRGSPVVDRMGSSSLKLSLKEGKHFRTPQRIVYRSMKLRC